MDTDEYISKMNRITGELHDLFTYPETGLFTWHELVHKKMKELNVLYYGTEKP